MMNLCFSLYENKFKKKPLPTQWSLHPLRFPRSRGTETPKGKGVNDQPLPTPPKGGEYKQPLMIANETLIGTLMKTEILTNNYTINYTNIIRRTVRR